jgi:hypothetical protein
LQKFLENFQPSPQGEGSPLEFSPKYKQDSSFCPIETV